MQTTPDDVVQAPAIFTEGEAMNQASRSKGERASGASDQLVKTIIDCIDDAKGEDIVEIDLAGKTAIADAMIIASGRSRRHVGAVADRVIKLLKEQGRKGIKVEGQDVGEWVLLDLGDVIVHIFQPEIRDFYNLEKMWSADRPEMKPV